MNRKQAAAAVSTHKKIIFPFGFTTTLPLGLPEIVPGQSLGKQQQHQRYDSWQQTCSS